jgi:hypothetical protein
VLQFRNNFNGMPVEKLVDREKIGIVEELSR